MHTHAVMLFQSSFLRSFTINLQLEVVIGSTFTQQAKVGKKLLNLVQRLDSCRPTWHQPSFILSTHCPFFFVPFGYNQPSNELLFQHYKHDDSMMDEHLAFLWCISNKIDTLKFYVFPSDIESSGLLLFFNLNILQLR